jgi:hypothetical protein
MRMGILEVHMGCHVDLIRTLWADYVRARSLAEDAAVVAGQVSTSLHSSLVTRPVMECDRWQEQEGLVDEFLNKASPFLEKNSFQRETLKDCVQNPAKLFIT